MAIQSGKGYQHTGGDAWVSEGGCDGCVFFFRVKVEGCDFGGSGGYLIRCSHFCLLISDLFFCLNHS